MARLGQRVVEAVVPVVAALVIAVVGWTLRFEDIVEEGARVETPPNEGIWCFWHQCTFLAGWRFRRFRAHVLISRSRDGELVARTLALLGYRTVRGSSSRGGVAGLLALRAMVERGMPVVFTADGPRGPIYVAKAGPVKLAQMTGYAVGSFHLEPEHAWVLGSWDRFMVPRPFSRVVVAWSRREPAPGPEADEAELEACRARVNAALERARAHAVAYLSDRRAGRRAARRAGRGAAA